MTYLLLEVRRSFEQYYKSVGVRSAIGDITANYTLGRYHSSLIAETWLEKATLRTTSLGKHLCGPPKCCISLKDHSKGLFVDFPIATAEGPFCRRR